MTGFEGMALPSALLKTLKSMHFDQPTRIQAEAIPLAMDGQDILGSAETGTGKTGAFGIPLAAHLTAKTNRAALVMAPTRELAAQVHGQLKAFLGHKSGVKTALLIGGDPIGKQLGQLRAKPRLIVGTPGRINDHLDRGVLDLSAISFLVLDGTDRMLDMGFTEQIEAVLAHIPDDRQTLLFSATIPSRIEGISHTYLNDPIRVSVAAPSAAADTIETQTVRVQADEKYQTLLSELRQRQGSIVMFVKTKYGTEKMAKRLKAEGFSASAIHGDLRQSKRDRVIEGFRRQKYTILVATDVAARGLDIPHIEHVINYDLPHAAADYIHRIGRTGRAGATGNALNLVVQADRKKWAAIERLLNPGAGDDASFDEEHGQRRRKRPHPSRRQKAEQYTTGQRSGEKRGADQRSRQDWKTDDRRSAPKKRRASSKNAERKDDWKQGDRRKDAEVIAKGKADANIADTWAYDKPAVSTRTAKPKKGKRKNGVAAFQKPRKDKGKRPNTVSSTSGRSKSSQDKSKGGNLGDNKPRRNTKGRSTKVRVKKAA